MIASLYFVSVARLSVPVAALITAAATLFTATACSTPADSALDLALLTDPEAHPDYPATMVEFTVSSAGARLPAHIYIANGPGPHPTVVLAHGIPGNERNLDLAQALRRFGFSTVFFHYRGAWGAEGDYSLMGQLDDVDAVLARLGTREAAESWRVDPDALSILGHSLGGFVALASGARNPALSCVMSLSPANPALWKPGDSDSDAAAGQDDAGAELAGYADGLFMLKSLSGERLMAELRATPVEALNTEGFGPALADKQVLMLVGEDDAATPAAMMFDPVVAAYEQIPGLDLSARHLPGDHSFSSSRVLLTRAILSWADTRCR